MYIAFNIDFKILLGYTHVPSTPAPTTDKVFDGDNSTVTLQQISSGIRISK